MPVFRVHLHACQNRHWRVVGIIVSRVQTAFMLAGVEASEAYLHIDHSDFVVEVAGSTWLAAVVLESCRGHGQEDVACPWLRLQVALRGHHQAKRHHQRHQPHSHCLRVRGRSSMPEPMLA